MECFVNLGNPSLNKVFSSAKVCSHKRAFPRAVQFAGNRFPGAETMPMGSGDSTFIRYWTSRP